MLDYLFKGLVTVNRNVDNSTHKEPRTRHSYDTTFLVVFVVLASLVLALKMCYDCVLKRAYRRARLAPDYGIPLYTPPKPSPLAPLS